MDEMQKLIKDAERSVSQVSKAKPIETTAKTPEVSKPSKNKHLKSCPSCGKDVDRKAEMCPHCGRKLKSKTGCVTLVVALFVGAIVVGGGMSLFQNSSDTQKNQKPEDKPQAELLTTEYARTVKKEHPTWSNQICNVIGNREIQIGMTKEQAIAAWEKPKSINESVGSWGKHEQWVYDGQYLYFENGILKSFQSSR